MHRVHETHIKTNVILNFDGWYLCVFASTYCELCAMRTVHNERLSKPYISFNNIIINLPFRHDQYTTQQLQIQNMQRDYTSIYVLSEHYLTLYLVTGWL